MGGQHPVGGSQVILPMSAEEGGGGRGERGHTRVVRIKIRQVLSYLLTYFLLVGAVLFREKNPPGGRIFRNLKL